MIEAGCDMNIALLGGNLVMQRDDGEPVPAFRARAREAALSVGAATLIFENLEPRWVDDLPDAIGEMPNDE